jgi:hypothetical protein
VVAPVLGFWPHQRRHGGCCVRDAWALATTAMTLAAPTSGRRVAARRDQRDGHAGSATKSV